MKITHDEWADIVALVATYAELRDGTNAWQAIPEPAQAAVEEAAKRLPKFDDDAQVLAYVEQHWKAPKEQQ